MHIGPRRVPAHPAPPVETFDLQDDNSAMLDCIGDVSDVHALILGEHGLELMCSLIRRGCATAAVLRLNEKADAQTADLVVIPHATGVGVVEQANIAPALCSALHQAWEDGDLVGFARVRDLLDPLHSALFAETNPIPLKAALAELLLCSDELRLPLTRRTAATRDRLAQVLPNLMIAEEHAATMPQVGAVVSA